MTDSDNFVGGTEKHEIFGGKVKIYRRPESRYWHCSACLDGHNWRASTREDSLSHAKDFAEDWYLELRGKRRAGTLESGKRFKEAAERFLDEYAVLTHGERSATEIEGKKLKLKAVILPYLGEKYLHEITDGVIQDYRMHRAKTCKTGKPPARSTMHQEIVAIRQVLKTAKKHGWIDHLPDLSVPYRASGKIVRRAWFPPEEYKKLYEATRERAANPKHNRGRWKKECEDFHDYVLFMTNTGLRPDEASRLEYRDVHIVTDRATNEKILEIEVRGKRGLGYCKSMPGAVRPLERMMERNKPDSLTTKIFGPVKRELLNTILDELGLKFDRDGQRRTAYSFRHTYICMRLMEGADIYHVAKNCRTSVEMIEKFYAAHIKDVINTEAVNRRRPREKPRKSDRSASA